MASATAPHMQQGLGGLVTSGDLQTHSEHERESFNRGCVAITHRSRTGAGDRSRGGGRRRKPSGSGVSGGRGLLVSESFIEVRVVCC